MANPSKKKGTRAETAVVDFLNERGWDAKRQPLSGNKDKGDILAVSPGKVKHVIEVKAGKQTANPSRSDLEEWISQAQQEARNCGAELWTLVVVRYRRKLCDADVYTSVMRDGTHMHCWLDKFADTY